MAVSTVKLNGTTLMTVNDTTATQADVNSSKYFYGADGVKRQGSATPSTPTLITKSITANGTYNASSDNADGYSSVTVNVSGGASNVVTGTFTGTTTEAAMDVTLNYSGTGYPIAAMIYVKGGAYDSVGDGKTFYDLIQRYAVAQWTMSKSRQATTPTYTGSGYDNYGTETWIYKSSTTSATTYSRNSTNTSNAYLNANATSSNDRIVTMESATKMSVYIAGTSYGFAANIEYTYHIIYSS